MICAVDGTNRLECFENYAKHDAMIDPHERKSSILSRERYNPILFGFLGLEMGFLGLHNIRPSPAHIS